MFWRSSTNPARRLAVLAACTLMPSCFGAEASNQRGTNLAPSTQKVQAVLSAGLDPERPFATDGWVWGLECLGRAVHAGDIPEQGVFGGRGDGSQPGLRFGKVPDPLDSTRQVFSFTAHRDDPRMWGAPRCEVIFSPTKKGRLPVGTEFWFGFGLLLPGWTATPDEQIVSQWHMGDGRIAFNPLFAISVQGGSLRFQARYNTSQQMSKAGVVKAVDVLSDGLPVSGWTYIVARARISADSGAGAHLQVWRDGREVLSYAGPLGYRIADAAPYAKLGHYHWIDASNPWPAEVPARTVLIRNPSFVFDKADQIGPEDLLGFITTR